MPEYIIRIEDATSQRSDSPVSGNSPPKNGAISDDKKKIFEKKMAIRDYFTSKAIMPMAHSAVTHLTSTVGLRTGSQENQQRIDAFMNTINWGANVGSNMFSAAAIMGPGGFAVGALVSLVTTAVQIGLKQAQINQQAKLEQEQIALYRSRLGAAYSGNRTGGVR